MALTATATVTAQKFIIQSLSVQSPELSTSHQSKMILCAIVDRPKIIGEYYFKGIIDWLKAERTNMERIIISVKLVLM